MPWHSIMSPGCASSGKITISSPTAQLALLTSVTDHMPSFSLTRSERPAQLGQSKMFPPLIPAGITISCPQPLHNTVGIAPLPRSLRFRHGLTPLVLVALQLTSPNIHKIQPGPLRGGWEFSPPRFPHAWGVLSEATAERRRGACPPSGSAAPKWNVSKK